MRKRGILLLALSLSLTSCGIINPNSVTKEIGENIEISDESVITESTVTSEVPKHQSPSEVIELPSESIKVGNGDIVIKVNDSNCKLKLINDMIMLLDVNNNATVYYQDTKVKTNETQEVYEGYLYSWACDSGSLVYGNENKSSDSEEDIEYVEENITSVTLNDKLISFFYRFSDDGYADVYLLEDINTGNYLGIHIYGKGDNLDDVVLLMKQYLL